MKDLSDLDGCTLRATLPELIATGMGPPGKVSRCRSHRRRRPKQLLLLPRRPRQQLPRQRLRRKPSSHLLRRSRHQRVARLRRLAIIVVGIGGCGYWLFQVANGPIDVGNEYLAAVQAGDFDEAWALSDSSCFEFGSAEALADVFAGENITGYELSGSRVSSTNGVTTGSTSGTITLDGDDDRSIQILASKPGDGWLVCGFDIGGPGSG